MDWVKKHVDTVVVLGIILSAVLWMNGKFNEVDRRFAALENEMERRFAAIEIRLTKIETILIVRGIMPNELASECDLK